jgi:phage terminase large subunit-like protein
MWPCGCPDWRERILSGRSLVPDLPLFEEEAAKALRVFKRLRVPDVVGTPTMAEACGEWFFPIVAALFGAFDEEKNVRHIQEIFQLIPKGNGKSSNGGAVMVAAMIVNRRPEAEFLFIAPTIEIAAIAFKQAKGTIRLDPDLDALFHIQDHIRRITHRHSGATLQIKAADTDVITGSKACGTMIDETHIFARRPNAKEVFVELRGALTKRPDGFLFQTTTQSKSAPAGVFASELAMARNVRDGKIQMPLLPILYELPQELTDNGGWKNPALWPLVNPNLGRSTSAEFLAREVARAEADGPDQLALIASQHFNVEIGLALQSNNWAGAQYWQGQNVDSSLTLAELLRRCEVAVVGIDGGGLDDLLGFSVLGREREPFLLPGKDGVLIPVKRWLHWGCAFAHSIVFDRRKEIAPKLLDFKADGDLFIVDRIGDDVSQVADLVEQVRGSSLMPETAAIGVDPVGIGAIVDELAARGIDTTPEAGVVVGIPQGWRLNNAIKTTERKLAGGEFVHAGTRLMAWSVGNARVEPRGNAITITKQASGFAKIDPLAALFNAVALMSMNPSANRSVYTATRGIIFVG